MIRRLLVVAVFLVAGRAATAGAESAQCSLLGQYRVASVTPHTVDHDAGFPIARRLRGAVLRVDAQPGLTREWLQRSVETAIANGECGFALGQVPAGSSVNVNVQSAADGFHVYVTSRDERVAREILSDAQRLGP